MGRFEKIACNAMDSTEALRRLSQLEQLLLRRMPQSAHMLIVCRMGLKQRYPKGILVEFYRYTNGTDSDSENWHNDPEMDSFILCIQKPNTYTKKGTILLPPANSITDDMVKTFDDFIGWDQAQIFHSVPDHFSGVIRDLCIKHGNTRKEGSEGIPSRFMVMLDIEKAKRMETTCADPTISLKDIELKHVPELVESWTDWAEDHTEKVLAECVQSLGGVGAFTDKGELASFLILCPIGEMSMFYTPPKFRRRGLGELVMRGLTKKIATEFEMPPYGEVVVGNVPSERLFQKLEFQELYKTKWIYFTPPN